MAVYTQAQYDALCASIAQGILSVEYADKKVTYRSLAEMKDLKRDMEIDLGIKSLTPKRLLSKFDKGL